jgi:hypothetical protein
MRCLMAVALVGACSPGPTTDDGATDDNVEVEDVRVDIPEPAEGYLDFVSPEVEIGPGEEKMYCVHQAYSGEALAVRNLEVSQGRYGHHVVFVSTTEPLADGTLEDCTDRQVMNKFGVHILPDTPLPDGYAIPVAEEAHLVMQFHYVNTGINPILVQDVARFELVDPTTVEHWTQPFATNSESLELPAEGSSTEVFDCVIPSNGELLILGGHMHEEGTSMEVLIGADEPSLESMYLVDPWRPDYRDAPPVSLFIDNPILVFEGDILRTRCDWTNTLGEEVIFPAEMCATFGYIAGLAEPWTCNWANYEE